MYSFACILHVPFIDQKCSCKFAHFNPLSVLGSWGLWFWWCGLCSTVGHWQNNCFEKAIGIWYLSYVFLVIGLFLLFNI